VVEGKAEALVDALVDWPKEVTSSHRGGGGGRQTIDQQIKVKRNALADWPTEVENQILRNTLSEVTAKVLIDNLAD